MTISSSTTTIRLMGEPTPQDEGPIADLSSGQAKETPKAELAKQLSDQMQTGIDSYRDDMEKSVPPPVNEWSPNQGIIDQLTQVHEAFQRLSADPNIDTGSDLFLTFAKEITDGADGEGKVVIASESADGTPNNKLARLLKAGAIFPRRQAQWVIDSLNRGSQESKRYNSRMNGPYGNTKGGNVALLPNGRILVQSIYIAGGGGGGTPGFAGSELYVTDVPAGSI